MSSKVLLSKSLSQILRHQIIELKLIVDNEGYVKVDDLFKLNLKRLKNKNIDDIKEVVESNGGDIDKQRFDMKIVDGIYLIRARQGHSIQIGELLNDEIMMTVIVKQLPFCIHGTTKENYEKIIKSGGLNRMKRNHIHFAKEPSGTAGIRENAEVLIYRYG